MALDNDIFSQINEDVLHDMDATSEVETTINGGGAVFDNQNVFEKLEKLRNEITSGTRSVGSSALTSQTEQVQKTIPATPKTSAPIASAIPQAANIPINSVYGRPVTTPITTVVTKTKAEILDEAFKKQTTGIFAKAKKETQAQEAIVSPTKKKSNWNMFDLSEDNISNDKKDEEPKIKGDSKRRISAIPCKKIIYTILNDTEDIICSLSTKSKKL